MNDLKEDLMKNGIVDLKNQNFSEEEIEEVLTCKIGFLLGGRETLISPCYIKTVLLGLIKQGNFLGSLPINTRIIDPMTLDLALEELREENIIIQHGQRYEPNLEEIFKPSKILVHFKYRVDGISVDELVGYHGFSSGKFKEEAHRRCIITLKIMMKEQFLISDIDRPNLYFWNRNSSL